MHPRTQRDLQPGLTAAFQSPLSGKRISPAITPPKISTSGISSARQHQQCERAEEIPEVEIFGGVIAGDMRFPERGDWKAAVNPGCKSRCVRGCIQWFSIRH